MMFPKKYWKRIAWTTLILFLIGNFIIYNHAYRFTNFVDAGLEKTKRPEELSIGEKLNTILFGISVPKPTNKEFPSGKFKTILLQSHEEIEAWEIKTPQQRGVVILFHGYSSSKSSQLPYAREFIKKGYSTLLVDFMGSGGSSGNTTTIGFKESQDVKEAFEYVTKENPGAEVILFGSSMGAAAIMRAVDKYDVKPDKIILECPFGSMLSTAKIRFQAMNIPSFPFAELLVFWGGFQNGYNAFAHKPIDYAKQINVPTLLLYGAKDQRVSRKEIDDIFENINGEKKLVVFEHSAHEVYLNDDKKVWNKAVDDFLDSSF